MKKYMFGFVAIVLAIGGAAFTAPVKKAPLGTQTFYFNNADYSEANVEDRNQWALGSSSFSCSLTDNKACELVVDEMYVNSTTHQLKPNFTIVAAQGSTSNVYYVSAITAGTIRNRP